MALPKVGKREGAGLSKGHTTKNQSSDADLYNAIRGELDATKAAGVVTQANASDLASAIALANANKVALNAIAAVAAKYTK